MDIANTIEAGAAVIGVLGGGLTFAFMTGKFVRSVEANTEVTEKLTKVIDNHLVWSAEWTSEASEKFHDHDVRISVLESK